MRGVGGVGGRFDSSSFLFSALLFPSFSRKNWSRFHFAASILSFLLHLMREKCIKRNKNKYPLKQNDNKPSDER